MVASIFPKDTSSEFSAFELLNVYAVFKGVVMTTVGLSQIPLAWLSKDMQQMANTNTHTEKRMIRFIRHAMPINKGFIFIIPHQLALQRTSAAFWMAMIPEIPRLFTLESLALM